MQCITYKFEVQLIFHGQPDKSREKRSVEPFRQPEIELDVWLSVCDEESLLGSSQSNVKQSSVLIQKEVVPARY